MLNYEVDPNLLTRYVPLGTTLDSFNGRTYLSLVAFRFCNTKLFGCLKIPFHANFEEVNLRFYVRREEGDEVRRGVVFIAEVVPRRAIALIARLVYAENYIQLPMDHRLEAEGLNQTAEYRWKLGDQWCTLFARTDGLPSQPLEGSLEQFITEHYWGYSTQRSGSSVEYHVSHPPWQIWKVANASFEGETRNLYGDELAAVLRRPPDSAFVADGSPVIVFRGNRIQ